MKRWCGGALRKQVCIYRHIILTQHSVEFFFLHALCLLLLNHTNKSPSLSSSFDRPVCVRCCVGGAGRAAGGHTARDV